MKAFALKGRFQSLWSVLLLLTFVLSPVSSAFAQETTGAIEGTIRDPQGSVIPSVTVTVASRASTTGARPDASIGFRRTVNSDEKGFFRMLEIPPGFYTITTDAVSGFGSATLTDIEVVLGKTTPVNITLQAGNITESVTVTGDAVTIDPTDNKIQTNITAQVAELLPKGTNFTSLLKVSPATRPEPNAGGFQVDGASGSENTFIIDGQEVTNYRTGVLNTNNNLPFQLVQEVQIKSSGFEAEFGGATGGVINVVTKGGTNDYHGEFGVQFRMSDLQAGSRSFLRRFAATGFQTSEYIRPPKNEGNDFFPTFNFGGPIAKDRLWFFASYTPQILRDERTFDYLSSDPRIRSGVEATETYRLKQRNEYAFFRLDAAPSDKIRLAGTFTWNPIVVEGAIPAFTDITSGAAGIPQADFGSTTLRGAEFLDQQGGRQNSNLVTGKFDWTPTNNLVVSVRGGRSYLNEKLGSYGIPTTTRFLCSVSGVFDPRSGCTPGFNNFATNFQIDFDRSIRKTLDADASYLVSGFGGRHQLKVGYQFNGISNETRQGYRDSGQVILFYGLGLEDILGLPTSEGAIGSGYLQRFATEGEASSNSQALFIQDSWQPVSRLTLNLGLRTERETVPSFNPDNPGIEFGWGDKLAPRFGFAYDLTGDGRSKVFGFYGWFYDRFKYELPRGSFGGDFFRRDYFEIFPDNSRYDFFTLQRILGNNVDVPGGNCPIVGGTGLSACQLDFRIPSNRGTQFLFESGAVDPDLKAARQSEFTVGFERDLGWTLLFSTRYTHKQVDRAIEDIGLPTPEGSEAYIIGNPGYGLAAQVARDLGYPYIKAERTYDALELRIDKRFTRRYYFNTSYTYSRLNGNYSGLASSDEAGRTSPNVNRFFDLPFIGFTANGESDKGRLPTDRPHVFKFYGAYTLDWFGRTNHATEFSTFFTAQSGTPVTSYYQFYSANAVLNGRGDLGRTEAYTQTDFALRHKYRMTERFTVAFDLDFLNLFNESNELGRFTVVSPANLNAGALGITPNDEVVAIRQIFNGGIRNLIQNYLDASPTIRTDARYNLANAFQSGREVRFGVRFLF